MDNLSWQITEPLDFHWTNEYVFLDAPDEAASIGAVTDGSSVMAAQFDSQRSALAVNIDLAPLQSKALRPSDQAPEPTGLRVERLAGAFALRNRYCSVKLAADVCATDAGDRWHVTGPIVSVVGPDGIPRCGSRLEIAKSRYFAHDRAAIGRVDAAKIAAEETPPTVRAAIEQAGEVFARYSLSVEMFDGRRYSFQATLYAHQPVLFVREQTDLARDGALEFSISENFGCDQYFFGGVGKRGPDVVPIPPYDYRLGSLSPHHTQSHTAYAWMGFSQSDRPQGSFRGICDTAIEPFEDAITLMAHQPWRWEYPSDVALQFNCHEGRTVTARGPIRRGMRTWCMFITDRSTATASHAFNYGAPREVSAFCLWHRKLNDIPLDWLRRLDLTSGAPEAGSFPLSMLTREEYEAKLDGVFRDIARLMRNEQAQDRPATLYARWVLDHDKDAAAALAQHVLDESEAKLTLVLNSGFLADAVSAVANRGLGPDAVYYEACVAAGAFTDLQARRLAAIMLFFAHATAEDALFPSHQNYLPPDHPHSIRNWAELEQYSDLFGTPNFQTDVYYNLGLYGAVFRKHPRSRAWLEDAARQLDDQLGFHFHEGGVYEESIGYFAHLFHNMLSLASVLKRSGVRDFFADARFQAPMNTLVDYLAAPRRATIERIVHPDATWPDGLMRFWPAIGDTGHNCSEMRVLPLMAHAAWEVREHNESLSDRLLAAWAECGRPLWGGHAPMFEWMYIRDAAPERKPLKLASRRFTNVGVVMRADTGTPSETSIFCQSGRATHHWGFDHGHFSLTTRGSLLLPDFGYHGTTEPSGGEFVHGSATEVHNVVTFGPDWNGGLGMERRGSERVIRLGGDYEYVVSDLSLNNVRHNNWRNIQHIAPIEYFRHLLFAHNRYVLVWDRIQHSVYRSQLRIHCLAESVEVDGGRARFRGLDGVDLLATVLAPVQPEFAEGIVGPSRYLLCENDCELDYLWVCQPVGPGEAEFAVSAHPGVVSIGGRDLHGVEFDDHILYAKGDAGAQVDIDGRSYRLDGRLAVVHRDAGGEQVHLLDAVAATI